MKRLRKWAGDLPLLPVTLTQWLRPTPTLCSRAWRDWRDWHDTHRVVRQYSIYSCRSLACGCSLSLIKPKRNLGDKSIAAATNSQFTDSDWDARRLSLRASQLCRLKLYLYLLTIVKFTHSIYKSSKRADRWSQRASLILKKLSQFPSTMIGSVRVPTVAVLLPVYEWEDVYWDSHVMIWGRQLESHTCHFTKSRWIVGMGEQ